MESEKSIEKFCQSEAKKHGGIAVKFSSPSNRGVPDRIAFFPNGKIGLMELKSTGKKATKLQQHWIDTLNSMGFKSAVIDSKEGVKDFIKELIEC